jgi:hypothetical protein
LRPLTIHRKGEAILGRDGLALEALPLEFQRIFPDVSPKYIDNLSLLAAIAAGRAIDKPLEENIRKDFAVIMGSAFGSLDSVVDFDAQALQKGPNTVNPMDFPNTVANAAGSRIGIWLQLKGPNVMLTNGETSFIDAIGFAWEGSNSGLFEHCLVGAVEKLPAFLKSLAAGSPSEAGREGACFLLASAGPKEDSLFQVVDYFALQLNPDLSVPKGFKGRFEGLWDGVEWLGCPETTPLDPLFPRGLIRTSSPSPVRELGLGGLESLIAFISGTASCGIVGAFSKSERKVSFIKINKKKGAVENGSNGN